jgi:hypothetical protein
MTRPDLLVILIDDLRFDEFGSQEQRRVQTPSVYCFSGPVARPIEMMSGIRATYPAERIAVEEQDSAAYLIISGIATAARATRQVGRRIFLNCNHYRHQDCWQGGRRFSP